MAKGAIAKQNVIKKLQEAFGNDFIGEIDKKVYLWSSENGENVQIALSLTCPKTPVEASRVATQTSVFSNSSLKEEGFDFESMGGPAVKTTTAEISPQEQENIRHLMEAVNLL